MTFEVKPAPDPVSVNSSDGVGDGAFHLQGVDKALFAVNNLTARTDQQGIGQCPFPLLVDGFNKSIPVTLKYVVFHGSLLFLQEDQGQGQRL